MNDELRAIVTQQSQDIENLDKHMAAVLSDNRSMRDKINYLCTQIPTFEVY